MPTSLFPQPTAIPTVSPAATPARLRWLFASFVAMLVLAALDQTILSTALPAIARDLQHADHLSWLFSAYLMAATVAVPLYGRLADIHGSRPLLLAAVALFLLGSAACGVAGSLNQLLAARAIQGAGGGGLLTLALLAVAELAPPQRRGPMQSALGAAYGLATMFGPLLGGVLVEHLSWRWAFFINMPVALAALVVLAARLPQVAARPPQRVDFAGAALLAAALVSLLLATRREVGTEMTLALLALGSAFTAAFIATQRRVRRPLLPLVLFTQPVFAVATALSAVSGLALFSAVVFLPTYLQTMLHLSPTASAWHLLPLMAGITVAANASGRRMRLHGALRSMALTACLLMVAAFVALALAFGLAPTHSLAISACVLPLGLGIGTLFPVLTAAAQRAAPPQHLGVATSTPIMLRSMGGALGVSALAALLAQQVGDQMRTGHGNLGAAYAAGAQSVYLVVALVCTLAALAAWGLPARLPGSASAQPPQPSPQQAAPASRAA